MSNLSSRVSGLRSQGLSFSRDGLDISLDVPDTRDVKDIFGTMATTIETQDDQLTGLHNQLEETSARQTREKQELVDWATKKFEEMQRENEMLREKLDNTKREFKNFTFNIQGFDDDAPPKTAISHPVEETPVIVEAESPPETGFPMFSTEQGAAPDLLTNQGDDEEEEEKQDSPGKLLPSMSSRRFGVPRQRSMNMTPKEVLRGWWKKAINSVIIKNRTARLALGFTKTRVQQSQSLMARVERIEDKLFELPMTLMRDMEYEVASVSQELNQEIKKCESAVEEGKAASQKSLEDVTLAMTSVRGDVLELDGALKSLDKMVQDRTGSQFDKLQEMEKVGVKVSETEALHAQNLRKKIKNLMTQMKSLNNLYEEANALVYGLMARNAIVAESSGEESIVMLLKLDAQLRQARESVMAIDGAATVLSKLVTNLKDDILTSRHGQDSHMDDDDRDDLIGACDHIFGVISKVESGVKNAQDFCKKHDENLADRWIGFANVIQAAKSTATLSAKLKAMQVELEEKPSQSQLREAMDASATDITPISNQITELKEIVARQREEMEEMKAKVVELQDKQQLIVSSKSGSRPASAAPTALPPIQAADRPRSPMDGQELGASLEPMIKDIIDTYLKAWSADNLHHDEQSIEWADSQKDDDSWFQGGVSEAQDEQLLSPIAPERVETPPGITTPPVITDELPEDEPVTETTAEQGESLEISNTPVLEDYLPTGSEPPSDSEPQSRATSRPASGIPDNVGHVAKEVERVTTAPASAPASGRNTPQIEPTPLPTISPSKRLSNAAEPAPVAVHDPAPSESRPSSKGRGQGSRTHSRRPSEAAAPVAVPVRDSRPSSRASSGARRQSSGADKGADSTMVARIREELREVTSKLEAMYINKMDAGTAESILKAKADKISLGDKADKRVIETIEDAIGKVTSELGDLRAMQQDGLKLVKAQMAQTLEKALRDLLQSERDSTRGVSLAATKAYCLSCGRESVAKQNAHPISPRGYLPSLNRSISPGPDVHRGGFKMPVSAPSGSTVHNMSKSVESLPGSPQAFAKRKNQHNDQMVFSRSLSTSLYNPGALPSSFNDDDSAKSGMMHPVPDIPVVAMPIGTNVVRPMYRKGFPAKKSSRPIVFSHEPFHAEDPVHLSGSLNVNTIVRPGRR